jgi:hypothetical protein
MLTSQISFHEAFRINGTEFYTITDLPIRVTNSIPEDTELAGSQVRPRCGLRNNPLLPFQDRDISIRPPPSQPYSGMSIEDMNANAGNIDNGQDDKEDQGSGQSNDNDLLNPGAGSLGDPLSQSASTRITVQAYSAYVLGMVVFLM